MKLVLYGKENLDDLEKLAHVKFNDIKNKTISIPKLPESPFSQDNLGRVIKLIPI
jgi:secreted Zn-dependent insulinase-like peptidase